MDSMYSKLFCVLMVILFTVLFCQVSNAEKCTHYCRNDTDCPSGYSCVHWTDPCQQFCLRTGKYQPDECPMKKCMAISCPLGFKRNDAGCEGCTCANEERVRSIESDSRNEPVTEVAEDCMHYCGNVTGVKCPSGYSCVKDSNPCKYTCHRTGKYQPDECPMVNCVAKFCPLGLIRNSDGCEGCTCANEELIRAIEEQHGGAAYQTSLHSLCLVTTIGISLMAANLIPTLAL